ncbi:MAG TPA: prolyl oligopeptidase family serine peptidase, partial [Dehalococcoidia bacterium]|nr:prolyl oligopeptidase family serine peptidase [Dehalococcoidia bacterium]
MDVAPYGTWKSPITSDLIVSESITIGQTALDGDDVYWTEMRPEEGGRYVIVRRTPDGTVHDVTPAPFNARTRVHEYGGGAYAVDAGTLFFSNFADQRLYRRERGEPRPLTPAAAYRYADYCIDRARSSVICVREDHTGEGEPRNAIVRIAADANGADAGSVLAEGNDFYSSPRLSPDGRMLAWLTWNHPNMPWDGTELWLAAIRDDGALGERRLVAGGPAESIFQPEWSPDGVLHFVSDRSGWWNLYRERDGAIEPLCAMEAEFGRPQWVFGMPAYAFASGGRIVCTYSQQGIGRLAVLDPASRALTPLDLPFTSYGEVRASGDTVVVVAGSETAMPCVVRLGLASGWSEVLRRSSEIEIDHGYLSRTEPIEFPTEGGLTAHAIYYAPANKDYRAPDGERPPLIVKIHGGPTSAATATLSLGIQYWTSRGFAVVDVNYGGSTGYGRAYRERLNGNWGIVDVDDCANAARFLVGRGDVDGKRLIITGGSAGGYTTLAALTFRDVFSAGASHFG